MSNRRPASHQSCYTCSEPATSREHAPPKCLFPEASYVKGGHDWRRNLITVPSCKAHNSAKSKDDEYLLAVLIHGFFNNPAAKEMFEGKMERAWTERPGVLELLYRKQHPVVVDGVPLVAVDVDRPRFNRSLRNVCTGLYFHEFGKPWDKPINIVTPLLLAMEGEHADAVNQAVITVSQLAAQLTEKLEPLGDNQEIFWYKMHVNHEKEFAAWQLMFFGGFRIFGLSHPTFPIEGNLEG